MHHHPNHQHPTAMLHTMSPITVCQPSQVGYRTRYHIPPPKISSIDQYPAQSGQITSPCRRSLSTHIAEGNSTAKAKAGTDGVVPRPSDEHPVIQKLKEALRIWPDQTTVLVSPVDLAFSWDLNTGQTLDDVDLYSLPGVEHFL